MATDRIGGVMQPMLACEMIAQVLEQSLSEWSSSNEITKGTALETIAKRLFPVSKPTIDDLKKLIASPRRLRAALQDQLGTVTAITTNGLS